MRANYYVLLDFKKLKMSKFEDLKNSISTVLQRTEIYKHGSSLVPKPNEKELTARLKPKELGVERGKENLPALDSTGFDEIEQNIINTMQEMADNTSEDVNEALTTYNDRLSSLSLSGKLDEIRQTCQSGISDFLVEVANGGNHLLQYKDDVRNSDHDLVEFRKQHKLRRSASYPEGGAKTLRIGIIVILFAIEFYGNSAFLSKGNEMGFVGAAVEAIYISGLNIGSAFLVGLFITRYLYHKSIVRKIVSFALTSAFVAGAVLFNLLVAHYREVSGSGFFGAVGESAIVAMKADPLGLESIEGWLLFSVGLMFWIISLTEAHRLDDKYPGYGAVARRARFAQKEYAVSQGNLMEELTAKREDGERAIYEARSELDAVLARIGTLKNARNALIGDYDIFKQQVAKTCVDIVEKYRNANRSVRDEVPSSFQLVPSLEFRHDIAALNTSFNADHELDSAKKARVLLEDSIKNFYSEFNLKIKSLESLSEVLER